jgi:hypothetical protein
MNRFAAALVLSLTVVPLTASAATPAAHPSASPKPHGAMTRGALMHHQQKPGTFPSSPPATHTMNKSATMQDRVPHSTSTPIPKPH